MTEEEIIKKSNELVEIINMKKQELKDLEAQWIALSRILHHTYGQHCS